MLKTYKVFAPRSMQPSIEALGEPVMRYDAFVVVRLDARGLRGVRGRFPFEDMSAQYRLPWAGGEVDPLADAAVRRSAQRKRPKDTRPHHWLVQFIGPVKAPWPRALERAGATVRHPTAGFGVIVRADAAALAAIESLPFVRWVGHLPHADRIAPALTAAGEPIALPRRRELPGSLMLEAFDGTDLPRLARAAESLGFAVAARNKRARSLALRFEGSAAAQRRAVATLAAVHGVRYILPRVMPRTSNNVAAGLIGRPFASGARPPALGLAGQGEVVAVCDTGLDTGDAANLHPDFAGRVIAIKSYPVAPAWRSDVLNAGADDGAADTDSGHGTHVAGSVLGNGSASAGAPMRIEGMAPQAQLVFQAVEQEVRWRAHVPRKIAKDRFQLAGIPADLAPLLAWARRKGARIHSNSWGGGEPGEYDAQCGQIDRFVWEHDDFVVLVAAGNDGSDTGGAGLPANGRINAMSISSPATAKNVITVGASENLRREFDADVYGVWWPDDFPRAPFRAAPMADEPRQIAAFSGRGPTLDGRIKPEVVAPGTFILSTRSSQIGSNNFGWGAWGPNKRDYFHMGGTSMATPIVAGAVALLREYLRKRAGIARPSAALVKALLIAGARPLQPIDGALADNDQGFGCVDLRRSLQRVLLLHESQRSLRTGEHAGLRLVLPRNGGRVRVVLAYSDFPGPQLVNNLNLFVIDPQGRPRAGNAVGRGEAALTLDARNNVEVVELNIRSGGAWGIEVVAANVPQGPQPFALAAVRVD